MPSAPLRNLANIRTRSRKFLAGDYFVISRPLAKNRLACGRALSTPGKSRAKTLRRKDTEKNRRDEWEMTGRRGGIGTRKSRRLLFGLGLLCSGPKPSGPFRFRVLLTCPDGLASARKVPTIDNTAPGGSGVVVAVVVPGSRRDEMTAPIATSAFAPRPRASLRPRVHAKVRACGRFRRVRAR